MRIIRTIAIIAALTLAGAVGGWNSVRAQSAPSPAAMQAAQELMAVLTKDTIKQVVTQVTAQAWPQIAQSLQAKQSITPAQLSELRTEYERIMFEFMTRVMAGAPAIYARYFTVSELQELLAFYRSPIAEKSMRVLPQITAETMAAIMPQMQQLEAQVRDAFTKVLRQRGFNI